MVLEKIAVLKELTIFSVLLRTVLAMVFSGILGYEREKKGRPAGFRTYMVVCIGSEIAMMTGIFLSRELGSTDPSRIAAQKHFYPTAVLNTTISLQKKKRRPVKRQSVHRFFACTNRGSGL